ncbi:MAG: NUDIX domain-containing protein [Bacteroidetes bacterium]|nr:NUDIX domain-containing protein [Bacteroidota bacterium]
MYKIFYNNRVVYLKEEAPEGNAGPGTLVIGYEDKAELQVLLDDFSENEQVQELHLFHPDIEELRRAFATCFKCINAGGGLVLNEKGEFLAIERNGVWDLPKGKMEKREDFETTALREVEEETGLTGLETVGLLLSTFHTYPLGDRMVLKETQWFEMHWNGRGDPVLQAEEGITDCRWVKPGQAGFIEKNSYASILDVLKLRKLL